MRRPVHGRLLIVLLGAVLLLSKVSLPPRDVLAEFREGRAAQHWEKVLAIGVPLRARTDLTEDERKEVENGIAVAQRRIEEIQEAKDRETLNRVMRVVQQGMVPSDEQQDQVKAVANRQAGKPLATYAMDIVGRIRRLEAANRAFAGVEDFFVRARQHRNEGHYEQAWEELRKLKAGDPELLRKTSAGKKLLADIENLKTDLYFDEGKELVQQDDPAAIRRGIATLDNVLENVAETSTKHDDARNLIERAEDELAVRDQVSKRMREVDEALQTGQRDGLKKAVGLLQEVRDRCDTCPRALPDSFEALEKQAGTLNTRIDTAEKKTRAMERSGTAERVSAIDAASAAWRQVREAALKVTWKWGDWHAAQAKNNLASLEARRRQCVADLLTRARDLKRRLVENPIPLKPERRAQFTIEAITRCDQVLAVDPGNRYAADWKNDVRDDLERQIRNLFYCAYVWYPDDPAKAEAFLRTARRLTGPSREQPQDDSSKLPLFWEEWQGWIDTQLRRHATASRTGALVLPPKRLGAGGPFIRRRPAPRRIS